MVEYEDQESILVMKDNRMRNEMLWEEMEEEILPQNVLHCSYQEEAEADDDLHKI
jgi:hypothetical protein